MARLRLPRNGWWAWFPWRRWSLIQEVEAADEIPEHIPEKGVVVVGTIAAPKWLAFDCPCKEPHRVMLNADARRRPHWVIKESQRLTLSPSVDERRTNKRCHYWIRRGRIRWVSAY